MNNHTLPPGYLLASRYKIEQVLGQGGFGISYKAFDNKLMQPVCVKELYISGNSTRGDQNQVYSQNLKVLSFADFVKRFIDEARKLAQFKHHNIVQVQDVFEENNTAYMVMEFVEGVTLKDLVERKGKLSFDEVIGLANQLLNAVGKVHQKGILHRDIKPDNLLLTDDNRLVLIDFGSARKFAEDKIVDQTVIVTQGYAPKEQYSNQAKRGEYTDIYSIGATLYFMVKGEKPPASVVRKEEEELKFPAEVPKEISNAISKAMEIEYQNRFQTVEEMKQSLKGTPPLGKYYKYIFVLIWVLVFSVVLYSLYSRKTIEPDTVLKKETPPIYVDEKVGDVHEKVDIIVEEADTVETVKIGNQIWMIGNISIDTFRNGEKIFHAKTKKEWIQAGIEKRAAWCVYDNDTNNIKLFGKLYNWYAIDDTRGFAPVGWRVPSGEDWEELKKNIGGKPIDGNKLKDSGLWDDENTYNELGFKATPSGIRHENAHFDRKGKFAHWWSSTSIDNKTAIERYLYVGGLGDPFNAKKGRGMSVILIKNTH